MGENTEKSTTIIEKMRTLLVLFWLFIVNEVFSQEIKVLGIKEMPDSVANGVFATDINGNDCSLLKISTNSIANLIFTGMIIGDVSELKDGSYVLNIPERTKHINYRHENYLPGVIDFTKYNISVKGRKVYQVVMESEKDETYNSPSTLQYLIFKYDVPVESLVVNGMQWNVSEKQSKKMVNLGHYSYILKTKDGRIINGDVDVKDCGLTKVVNIK